MELYDYQRRFIADQSRFRIVVKARQIGATTMIALEAVTLAIARPGATILIVSASFRQAMDVLRRARLLLAPERRGLVLETDSKTEIAIERWGDAPWRSRIVSLPASPSTVRGYTADVVYLDEFAHVQDDAELLTALQPSIATGGRLAIVSTPYGMRGEFWHVWSEGGPEWSRYDLPWRVCPRYDEDWYAAMRPLYSEAAWAQEFEGSAGFIAPGDTVFEEESLLACVDPEVELIDKPVTGRRYVMGVDLGRKRDWTAIVVLDVTRPTEYRLVWYDRFRHVPWPEVVRRVSQTAQTFRADLLVDATGLGDPILQHLTAPAEGFVFTRRSKTDLIQRLVMVVEQKRLRMPLIPQLMAELRAYRWDDEQLVTDSVMALGLAVWHAETGAGHTAGVWGRR